MTATSSHTDRTDRTDRAISLTDVTARTGLADEREATRERVHDTAFQNDKTTYSLAHLIHDVSKAHLSGGMDKQVEGSLNPTESASVDDVYELGSSARDFISMAKGKLMTCVDLLEV